MKQVQSQAILATVFALGFALTTSATAADRVKIAASFVGLWDTSQPSICDQRGEFKKAGLEVEITSTRGGSETVQAVIAGGADIGYSPGTNAVIAAYVQGAPIRIVSSEFVGQNDTIMYVPSGSPINNISDLAGKKVAFPRPGGSSEAMLLAFRAQKKLDFELVATGGLGATRTMVMTKQVDVGFTFPPWGLDRILKGELRILFSGDAATEMANVTNRVNIAHADFVSKRRPVATKFMQVLDKCIDWAYANQSAAAKMLAKLAKVSNAEARKAITFYSREKLAFAPIRGLKQSIKHAIANDFISKTPTQAQLDELIDIVYMAK